MVLVSGCHASRNLRTNIAIVLLQNHYVPRNHPDKARWRWVFRDACPVKWSGPEFRAGTAEVAFESIELVHKGLYHSEHNGRKQLGFGRDLLR